MAGDALVRVRAVCLALPEAEEVEAWGEPTFRVRNKIFVMYAAANNHHGAGHHAIWCKATPTNQQLMIAADPERYFSPPYVAPRAGSACASTAACRGRPSPSWCATPGRRRPRRSLPRR